MLRLLGRWHDRAGSHNPRWTWGGPVVLSALLLVACGGAAAQDVAPRPPVAFYDFEHLASGDLAVERDQGSSGTPFHLVNGGAAMRVRDGAHAGSTWSIQTRQLNPGANGNDDWKGGIFSDTGVLSAFAQARGITIMGWVKRTGIDQPAPNSNTADPTDRYNAVGLMGILSGTSTGHEVRALLEGIRVADTLRLVALGRRIDEGSSRIFAAREKWEDLLPLDEWVFLAATFDFDDGMMALYRNGLPLDGFYTSAGDLWGVAGPPEPDLTSPTVPRGIKLGGSFPQNSEERNPFDGRFDDVTFLDTVLTSGQVLRHYQRFRSRRDTATQAGTWLSWILARTAAGARGVCPRAVRLSKGGLPSLRPPRPQRCSPRVTPDRPRWRGPATGAISRLSRPGLRSGAGVGR